MEVAASESTVLLQHFVVPAKTNEEIGATTKEELDEDAVKQGEITETLETDEEGDMVKTRDSETDGCTLDENTDPELTNTWRNESNREEFNEDYSDDESDEYDDYTDEEEEAAAEEWLDQYYMRQRGLSEILSGLPSTIKITRIQETEEDRMRREEKAKEELARRREEHRKMMTMASKVGSGAKGKRKFTERMSLEEAERKDFGNGQDYVDFLNSKLQNVSIKITR